MLKKTLLLLLATLGMLSQTQAYTPKSPYEIHVHLKGVTDTNILLAHHFADKKYVDDTIRVDHNGWGVFKGDSLLGGIYLIAIPGMTYFEIIVSENEPKFTVETDKADFVMNMKVTGSPENQMFYDYLQYISPNNIKVGAYNNRILALKDNKAMKDSVDYYNNKIKALNEANMAYEKDLIDKHPNFFISHLLNMMMDVVPPPTPTTLHGDDSLYFAYNYTKKHFWDKTDFCDHRILRTPVLKSKIDFYLDKISSPIPDSLIISSNLIIHKSECDREVFKYCVVYLTNRFETSQVMCQENVFVNLAINYYLSGKAYWADTGIMRKINDRVSKLKYCDCNTTAVEMSLPDSSGTYHSLHAMPNDITVLYFFADDCSHCKETTPHMDSIYQIYSKKGIGFYAVDILRDRKNWLDFVHHYKLTWLNVWDPMNTTNFRFFYDIYSTPVVYVLDKDKKIIGKRIDWKQLPGFLDHLIDENKKQKK